MEPPIDPDPARPEPGDPAATGHRGRPGRQRGDRGGPPWGGRPRRGPGGPGGDGLDGAPWNRGRPWGHGRAGSALRLAAFVAVVQVVGSSAAQHYHVGGRALHPYGYLLLLAGPAVLALRVRWRVATLALVLAITLAYYLLDYPPGPGFLAALAAVLGAVRVGHRLAAQALCAAAYVVYVTAGQLVPPIGGIPVRTPTLSGAIGLAAWLIFALVIAEAIRVRSVRFAEQARARAEQARARAEQQRRQASEERLRIARELHDVLGHHLSLINVQAGVGLHLMDERPEQARTSLLAIKQASAEALREVRSVLGVLRPEDEAAPRAPAPSLANLAALLEGTTTELTVTGTPREVPAELDRAAYRIAQEALTNVRRHAGPDARATVTIGYGEAALRVLVEDTGTGGDPDGVEGNGIAGMRARAAALGGTLTAGPGLSGGFRVEASLPWEDHQ